MEPWSLRGKTRFIRHLQYIVACVMTVWRSRKALPSPYSSPKLDMLFGSLMWVPLVWDKNVLLNILFASLTIYNKLIPYVFWYSQGNEPKERWTERGKWAVGNTFTFHLPIIFLWLSLIIFPEANTEWQWEESHCKSRSFSSNNLKDVNKFWVHCMTLH